MVLLLLVVVLFYFKFAYFLLCCKAVFLFIQCATNELMIVYPLM